MIEPTNPELRAENESLVDWVTRLAQDKAHLAVRASTPEGRRELNALAERFRSDANDYIRSGRALHSAADAMENAVRKSGRIRA